jgi:putative holliday junction resolvase
MKYLGIDYGTKKVGIASSDDEGRMAYPALITENTKELVAEIKELCRELKIDEVVIGQSVNNDGKENPIMKEIREFAVFLEHAADLPIHFEKEWMTSVEAHKTHTTTRNVDDAAAALILQRYLDKVNKPVRGDDDEETDDEDEEEEENDTSESSE